MAGGEAVLYSDGGAELGGEGAGACILRDSKGNTLGALVLYLGSCTNNEGEICAGLLGFSLLHSLSEQGKTFPSVRWVCDSEYVLKSATGYIHAWQKNGWKTASKKPVKNQGLWKTYLELARPYRIVPEHVRGHSGHPENEACDTAVTWARAHGADCLKENPLGASVEINARARGFDWMLVDGREFLSALRVSEDQSPDPAFQFSLIKRIEQVPKGERKAAVSKESSSSPQFEQLLDQLAVLHTQAGSLAQEDERAKSLAASLGRLIKRFE